MPITITMSINTSSSTRCISITITMSMTMAILTGNQRLGLVTWNRGRDCSIYHEYEHNDNDNYKDAYK